MVREITIAAVSLILTVCCGTAQDRQALVIGNGDYQYARKLSNPANDASDVGRLLTQLGWETSVVEDADIRGMFRALRLFCERAQDAKAALFFYAGHGIEVNGKNYLLPVDAELTDEDSLSLESLALERVLGDLEDSGVALKVVVLDSCRDNPISRSWIASRSGSGGFAAIPQSELPEGTMLVYSTAPGQIALDGTGRNSPFTSALLERIQNNGGGFSDVFADVATKLGDSQKAWIRFDGSGLSFTAFRDFSFNANANTSNSLAPAVTQPTPTPAMSVDPNLGRRQAIDESIPKAPNFSSKGYVVDEHGDFIETNWVKKSYPFGHEALVLVKKANQVPIIVKKDEIKALSPPFEGAPLEFTHYHVVTGLGQSNYYSGEYYVICPLD